MRMNLVDVIFMQCCYDNILPLCYLALQLPSFAVFFPWSTVLNKPLYHLPHWMPGDYREYDKTTLLHNLSLLLGPVCFFKWLLVSDSSLGCIPWYQQVCVFIFSSILPTFYFLSGKTSSNSLLALLRWEHSTCWCLKCRCAHSHHVLK